MDSCEKNDGRGGSKDEAPGHLLTRYLDELVTDMHELNEIQEERPGLLQHAHILLTAELERVWNSLCSTHQMNFLDNQCESQAPEETNVILQEKITFPQEQADNYVQTINNLNCASLKCLENETNCHILIRGEGSLLDSQRESRLKNYAGWEHLSEPLHLLVQASDATIALCTTKLANGVQRVKQYLMTQSTDNYQQKE